MWSHIEDLGFSEAQWVIRALKQEALCCHLISSPVNPGWLITAA